MSRLSGQLCREKSTNLPGSTVPLLWKTTSPHACLQHDTWDKVVFACDEISRLVTGYLRCRRGRRIPGRIWGDALGPLAPSLHLSQRYRGAPLGLGLPHSVQNFPRFTAPQLQVQPVGRGLPHSVQNLPEFCAPQEQVQEAGAAGVGSAA